MLVSYTRLLQSLDQRERVIKVCKRKKLVSLWVYSVCLPPSGIVAVNPASPYPELAGIDPNSKYASIQGGLHDYGSYIVSCECIDKAKVVEKKTPN